MNLKMRNDKKNVIVELTFDFSIKSVLFCELLELEKDPPEKQAKKSKILVSNLIYQFSFYLL